MEINKNDIYNTKDFINFLRWISENSNFFFTRVAIIECKREERGVKSTKYNFKKHIDS